MHGGWTHGESRAAQASQQRENNKLAAHVMLHEVVSLISGKSPAHNWRSFYAMLSSVPTFLLVCTVTKDRHRQQVTAVTNWPGTR
jgi:hypothetical protein